MIVLRNSYADIYLLTCELSIKIGAANLQSNLFLKNKFTRYIHKSWLNYQ